MSDHSFNRKPYLAINQEYLQDIKSKPSNGASVKNKDNDLVKVCNETTLSLACTTQKRQSAVNTFNY